MAAVTYDFRINPSFDPAFLAAVGAVADGLEAAAVKMAEAAEELRGSIEQVAAIAAEHPETAGEQKGGDE